MTEAGQLRAKALVLAAGMGSRLQPLTLSVPKCLVPINGHALLSYWFAALREASIRDVLINTHSLRDEVAAYIDRLNQAGYFHVKEAFEPQLLGSAGTIAANCDWLGDAELCLVVYADNLSTVNLCDLISFHQSHDDPFTMMLFRAHDPRHCGIATLDSDARVIGFQEKPQFPSSDLANAGVYVISADAFREIADQRAFDLGHDVLPRFVGRMRGWLFEGYHRDIGTIESLELARKDVPKLGHRWPELKLRPAVFLDRDGTVIEHVHHLTDPSQVRLLNGAPEAIRRLQSNGYACIIVTNQSVVGRGMLSETGLKRVNDEMLRQLAVFDVQLDGVYFCPVVPQQEDPTIIEHPDRKPGPGMIRKAAQELSLDVSKSWMVGDSISDVLAGQNAGCKGTVLVTDKIDDTPAIRLNLEQHNAVDLGAAAKLILQIDHKPGDTSDYGDTTEANRR
jgi:mannose-1-phosphate guanylyltransferase